MSHWSDSKNSTQTWRQLLAMEMCRWCWVYSHKRLLICSSCAKFPDHVCSITLIQTSAPAAISQGNVAAAVAIRPRTMSFITSIRMHCKSKNGMVLITHIDVHALWECMCFYLTCVYKRLTWFKIVHACNQKPWKGCSFCDLSLQTTEGYHNQTL